MTKEEISKLPEMEQVFIYSNHLENYSHKDILDIAHNYDYLVYSGVL